MMSAVRPRASSERAAGHWLRCFLETAMVLLLAMGSGGVKAANAATCAAPSDMSVPRLQGTVYGPSGVAVPQILVRVERDGKAIAQTQTDDHGKFAFKIVPGNVKVHVQFLGSKSLDFNVRVGHSSGGFFRTPRLRIVLGVSGTVCSFVTTSSKQFKNEIKRYQQHLVEVPPAP